MRPRLLYNICKKGVSLRSVKKNFDFCLPLVKVQSPWPLLIAAKITSYKWVRLSHNSPLLLCLFAIDVHEQWQQNTASAFNTIDHLNGYYFIQTGQNLSFFCNSLCALTKFHIRCYLWSNEFQLWREETTTTITAEAWGQCGVPRDNWMSLIVCPMRSRKSNSSDGN